MNRTPDTVFFASLQAQSATTNPIANRASIGGDEFGLVRHFPAVPPAPPSTSGRPYSSLQPQPILFNFGPTPAPTVSGITPVFSFSGLPCSQAQPAVPPAIVVGRSAYFNDGLARTPLAPVTAQPFSTSANAGFSGSGGTGFVKYSSAGAQEATRGFAAASAEPNSVVGSGLVAGDGAGVAGGSIRLVTTAKQTGWMRTALATALQPFRSCMAPAPLPAAPLAAVGAVEPSANRPQANEMTLNLAAGPQAATSTFVPHTIASEISHSVGFLHHFAVRTKSPSQEELRFANHSRTKEYPTASTDVFEAGFAPMEVASAKPQGLQRLGPYPGAAHYFTSPALQALQSHQGHQQSLQSLQRDTSRLLIAVNDVQRKLVAQSNSQSKALTATPVHPSSVVMKSIKTERRLVFAAYMSHYTEVVKLLEQGVDVNPEVELGSEIWEPDSDWSQAVAADTRDPEMGGFDVDSDPPYGSFTPLLASLSIADDEGHVALLLLRCGADDKIASRDQTTALMLATKKGYAKVVRKLLELKSSALETYPIDLIDALSIGAGPSGMCASLSRRGRGSNSVKANAVDSLGRSALLHACSSFIGDDNEECIMMLLAAGAAVNTAVFSRNRSAHATGSDGNTCLHYLCQKRRTRMVRVMLAFGATVDRCTAKGETPLIAACGERWGRSSDSCGRMFYTDRVTLDRHITLPSETVAVLLRAGANVHAATTTDKVTALHKACEYADMATCRMLLARGADPHVRNKEGKTPLDVYGSKQSFTNPVDACRYINPALPPPPKDPVLSDADRKTHVAQLVEARRLHLAIPLLKALFSARILERGAGAGIGTGTGAVSGMGPVAVAVAVAAGGDKEEVCNEAKAGAKAPPKAPKALSRVLGNDDLIALITAWL